MNAVRDRSAVIRNQLLAEFSGKWNCPADAIRPIISELGYQVKMEPLEPGIMGQLRPKSKEIVVCQLLPQKLAYPKAAPAVVNFTLGHELGHLILHHLEGVSPYQITQQHEREADDFSGVFLCPHHLMRRTAELDTIRKAQRGWVDLSSEDLWGLTIKLARRFRVSAATMRVQLTVLDYVHFDQTRRRMRVRACR